MDYQQRIADSELETRLQSIGAVLIEGPKACGKTETARQQAASEVLLDVDEAARKAADINPGLVLEGETPRLIDEWQVEPKIWDHVRREVDRRNDLGQFILAGSAQPSDDETRHTGAGRFSRLQMRPMSLLELGTSTGAVSLSGLLSGEAAEATDTGLELQDVADELCRGGWPRLRQLGSEQALPRVRDYLGEVVRFDLKNIGPKHRPNRVMRLAQSLARNLATSVTATTLAEDSSQSGDSLSSATVGEYLDALKRLFIVEDQPSWRTHLRSTHTLRKAPKRHFVDPSLAVAALRGSPKALMEDFRTFGLFFESMVVRDLRIYAQPMEATIEHYRDSADLEVDAIVNRGDGVWGAFEIKIGGEKAVNAAAKSLLKFTERVDTSKVGKPAALGIITATGYAYERKDGVQVLPIGSLAP